MLALFLTSGWSRKTRNRTCRHQGKDLNSEANCKPPDVKEKALLSSFTNEPNSI